jgi:hypothetical protein
MQKGETQMCQPVGPPPCDSCAMRDLCYEARLACEAFHEYTLTGEWKSAPGNASRARYDSIYRRRERTWAAISAETVTA